MIFRPLFWKIFSNVRAYSLRVGNWVDYHFLALWLGLCVGAVTEHLQVLWFFFFPLLVSIGLTGQVLRSGRLRCWRCGARKLYKGPRGGMSYNALCASCGSRFSVTPALRRVDVVVAGPREITPSERELFHLDTGEPM